MGVSCHSYIKSSGICLKEMKIHCNSEIEQLVLYPYITTNWSDLIVHSILTVADCRKVVIIVFLWKLRMGNI